MSALQQLSAEQILTLLTIVVPALFVGTIVLGGHALGRGR